MGTVAILGIREHKSRVQVFLGIFWVCLCIFWGFMCVDVVQKLQESQG